MRRSRSPIEIGVMHDGRIEQWDAAYELYHRPATRFVADFVGQGVFLRGSVTGPRTLSTELGDLGTALPAPGNSVVDVLLRPDDIVHDDD
jgi:iron(III) transport system ATP-binding protein